MDAPRVKTPTPKKRKNRIWPARRVGAVVAQARTVTKGKLNKKGNKRGNRKEGLEG